MQGFVHILFIAWFMKHFIFYGCRQYFLIYGLIKRDIQSSFSINIWLWYIKSPSIHSHYIWLHTIMRRLLSDMAERKLTLVVTRERKTNNKDTVSLGYHVYNKTSHTMSYSLSITSFLLYISSGSVSCVNQHHLLVNYLHDVKDILQVYELSTGKHVRDLPLDVGTVGGVSCKKKHSEFFYKFTSFTTPGNSGIRSSIPRCVKFILIT